ncbi:MAG TPA: prolyl oligopeptidase family serine peptidase [Pyrinomonadaceae bacterium]|nr:prolyl oligopeptidase family serine peptidase [Pyrinomonadaceae bacterium]
MFNVIIRRVRFIALLILLIPSAALADTGFIDRKVIIGGTTYRYQVYIPADFSRSRKWPVIVFLHSNGVQGVDGLRHTDTGLASLIRHDRTRVPAIVVFPQAAPSSRWSNPAMQELILACLDAAAREFNGDADRFYLIGYSMGGQGVLRLSSRWPNRFAALVNISGTVIAKSPSATSEQVALDVQTHPFLTAPDIYRALAQLIAATPVWIFHGDTDASVPVEQSRQLVNALRSAGATVRYTEYTGAGHSIDERALSEPELLPWLLSHTRRHSGTKR